MPRGATGKFEDKMAATIGSALSWWGRTKGDRNAIVVGDEALDSRTLRDWSGRIARLLVSRGVAAGEAAGSNDPGGEVVLDYCAMVRGILNDDQGGPLHPPGLRMAEALTEVRASLQRNLEAKKGGPRRTA